MPTIRPYRAADLGRVYEICTRTGLSGGDATGRFSSDDLIPDVFAAPYVTLEPELAFVAEHDGQAAGYILATANTRRFVDRYRAEWLPGFAQKYTHVEPPQGLEQEFIHMGYT